LKPGVVMFSEVLAVRAIYRGMKSEKFARRLRLRWTDKLRRAGLLVKLKDNSLVL